MTDPKSVATIAELADIIAGNNTISVSDVNITELDREDPRWKGPIRQVCM
jgi:hypothetical protein